MAEEQLQEIIDGLRTRLQADLETQLGTIAERHTHAVERARQVAEAEAEQRWTARLESTEAEWMLRLDADLTAARAEAEREWASKIEATRTEWRQRLEVDVASARADAERRLTAEAVRFRGLAEQAATESAAAARREMEAALQAERQQAQALEAERARVERALTEARAALDIEKQRVHDVVAPARHERAGGDAARLLESMRVMDAAHTLSDVLGLTAAAAALEAPRAGVFVANGPQLEEWTVPALTALSSGPVRIASPAAGVLGEAVLKGEPQEAGGDGIAAPGFAALTAGRAALAVPLQLAGQTVAVVYADEGPDGDAPEGWRDAVQILGRHASACLAFLTATRTAQAMRLAAAGTDAVAAGARQGGDDQAARRYARLLVSELKLYNEAAVRVGREKRDLLRRLKPEIDRARRLYDERFPAAAGGRDDFQQELVQTLADGDPALLG